MPVCATGGSIGGIAVLQGLFRQIPTDLGLACVVFLHLSPDQPSAPGQILSACTRMPVRQIEDGPTPKPDRVYVVPPDRELVIEGHGVAALPFSEPRGRRAPIDMLFRSVAAVRGEGIAVVLSGAGTDGAAAVRAVKEAGGVAMVQEPADAGFASMPQSAVATGAADFIAPTARQAERLKEVAQSKEAVRSLDMDGAADDLRRIVAFLRARTGHDFSGCKRATVMRRVTRRIGCRSAAAKGSRTTPTGARPMSTTAAVRAGGVLVAWRLDRLGRSLPPPIEAVRDLEGRGVGPGSLTEGTDTTTPGGRLVFHVFGAPGGGPSWPPGS